MDVLSTLGKIIIKQEFVCMRLVALIRVHARLIKVVSVGR
jgi:hypothetical protein